MSKVVRWLYDNYAFTGITVLWGFCLFTAVTIKVFFDPTAVPVGTATAYGTFFVLSTTVIGLWKWRVGK